MENSLIRKLRLISKVTKWKRNNYNTHIAQYLKKSIKQGNQTMKPGQLIEHNMKNIFFEKSYTKCDEETNSRPSYKFSISLDQQPEILHSLFFYRSKSRFTKTYAEAATGGVL